MRFSLDKDFVLSMARIFWGTGLGKIGGTIALAGATSALGLWPWIASSIAHEYLGWETPPADTPLWFSIALVFIGAGTAILGTHWQRQSQKTAVSPARPHDLDLYRRFRTLVSDNEISFMKDFDFGNSFDMRYIKGVLEVGEVWTEARYEFSVPKFEDRFGVVKECARLFAESVATHVHNVNGNPNWGTTKPLHFDGNYTPALRTIHRELNERATAFHREVTEFERLVRPELFRD